MFIKDSMAKSRHNQDKVVVTSTVKPKLVKEKPVRMSALDFADSKGLNQRDVFVLKKKFSGTKTSAEWEQICKNNRITLK